MDKIWSATWKIITISTSCAHKNQPPLKHVKMFTPPLPQAHILYSQIQLFFMKTSFLWYLLKMFASEAWKTNHPTLQGQKQIQPHFLVQNKTTNPHPLIFFTPLLVLNGCSLIMWHTVFIFWAIKLFSSE